MIGIDFFFWIFLVILAITAIRLSDLYSSVFVLGGFSFVISLIWTWLHAVDVAFTEAAVGAGIFTLFYLAAIHRTHKTDKKKTKGLKIGNLILLCTIGALLVYSTTGMPDYGDPQAPIQTHVAPHYIENSYEDAGVPNIVTAILAYYRGYDTLGEVTVIFTALMTVILLLRNVRRQK